VPNIKELISIVNYQNVVPAVSAAFDMGCTEDCTVMTCSCTQPGGYWSSASSASSPIFAWFVGFGDGSGFANFKTSSAYVRAVRGGL